MPEERRRVVEHLIVNEYGNIPGTTEFALDVDHDIARLSKLVKPDLDRVRLDELPVAISYIIRHMEGYLAEYQVGRQTTALKARKAGKWEPGLDGPGTYVPAGFTIDDVQWFDGYMLDARTWANYERGEPFRGPSWNGHAMPMFTMEQAVVLADHLNPKHPNVGDRTFMYYDLVTDAWYVKDSTEDVWDDYPGTECLLATGEVVKMYPVCAGYWIWDGCPATDIPYLED
jgi:hypothetical protein